LWITVRRDAAWETGTKLKKNIRPKQYTRIAPLLGRRRQLVNGYLEIINF